MSGGPKVVAFPARRWRWNYDQPATTAAAALQHHHQLRIPVAALSQFGAQWRRIDDLAEDGQTVVRASLRCAPDGCGKVSAFVCSTSVFAFTLLALILIHFSMR